MICNGAYIDSYFFWVGLSGMLAGFAISRITRSSATSRFPDRAKSWKWIFFSLYLSMSVVFVLAGAFLPSSLCKKPFMLTVSEDFLDIRLVYMFCCFAILAFLASRFRRAAGLPILFFLFVVGITVVLLLYPWNAADKSRPIAQFRILSQDDDGSAIELIRPNRDTIFQHIEGRGVQFHLDLLTADGYYFFMKKPFLHRLTGVSHLGGEDPHNLPIAADFHFWPRGGEWFQDRIGLVPGWHIQNVIIAGENLIPFFLYGIYIDNYFMPYLRLEESDTPR